MKHCCEGMTRFASNALDKNTLLTPDDLLAYVEKFDEYGIIVHDGGSSYVLIAYCPWCGKKLPEPKRDAWFEELEKRGIMDPSDEGIPAEFKSGAWWKAQKGEKRQG